MKEVKLSKGQVALVDDEDYERVIQHPWGAQPTHRGFYATRWERKGEYTGHKSTRRKLHMHRYIMGVADPKILIDHKDGNGSIELVA